MLSDEDRRQILAEIEAAPRSQAALPETLLIVQRHHGWVSDEHLRQLAEMLQMTPAEVDSVASFYNLVYRKPVGRHVILLCDSVSCWVMGFATVRDHLMTRLGIRFGQTTADGLFTLLPVVCLGACDQAPAMMIDDRLFGNLDPARIDALLEHYASQEIA